MPKIKCEISQLHATQDTFILTLAAHQERSGYN